MGDGLTFSSGASAYDENSFTYQRFTLKPGEEIDYNKCFLVYIKEDNRKDGSEKADGKIGLCLGLFNEDELYYNHNGKIIELYISKKVKRDSNGEDYACSKPLIQVDDDDYIWGIGCSWTAIYQGEELSIEATRTFVRERICNISSEGLI